MDTIEKQIYYGVQSGMVGGRYAMRVDGYTVGTRTFARRETAVLKALEFAQHVHADWTDTWMHRQWHFTYHEEPFTAIAF